MNMALSSVEQGGVSRIVNALTVDVEDYFQVEAFKDAIDPATWDRWPARVVENTGRVLALLNAANIQGTFFVLGWVAERFPEIVHRIIAEGHEVASHGYAHRRAGGQTKAEFRDDIRRAKAVLEGLCNGRIRGYRAPTFSISPDDRWAYEILVAEGYEYSSSIYPISHDLYGTPHAPRRPFRPLDDEAFLEVPLATVRLLNKNRPCAGGGCFRLLPYAISQWSIRRLNNSDQMPCVFYCHPWEFDPEQPRVPGISLKSRVRHYTNLGAMEHRVNRLVRDFAWGRMDEGFLGIGHAAGS